VCEIAEESLMFPEQCEAVYNIIRYLIDRGTLSNDPLTVEMTRRGYPPIFPCKKGFIKLDINQIEWARNNGNWWFMGPIKTLEVTDVKMENLFQADIELLKRLAKKAEFNLNIIPRISE